MERPIIWGANSVGIRCGHLLHVGLVTYGIHWSTAFSSSLILACGPVFTLLILHWHGHERLTRGQVAGVAVACLGVLTFLSDKLSGGHWRASAGDLVLLVAASFFSYYTVASKPLIDRLGGVTVMTYGVLFGSLPVVALSLPAGLAVPWRDIGPSGEMQASAYLVQAEAALRHFWRYRPPP